jgi:transcriptional regulator with XRE-family HTH domain
MTVPELQRLFADRARARRLALDLTQKGLAARAGLSLSSLKRFEQTGRVAFDGLLRLAVALNALDGLEDLFAEPEFQTLDDVLAADAPKRQRGRRP